LAKNLPFCVDYKAHLALIILAKTNRNYFEIIPKVILFKYKDEVN